MPEGKESLQAPAIDVYYMKMTVDQVNARLGKLPRGRVVALPLEQARAFLMAGVAEQVSSAEYEQQTQQKRDAISGRQQAFLRLNQGADLWDVSTHRDVLTASEEGLRRAYDAGMPLANLQYLRDANGDPLDQDADIEDIIEARNTLHPNEVFPQEAHDRSSVMGGGSHFQIQGGPQPLTPKYRAFAQRLGEVEQFGQQPQNIAADQELGRPRTTGGGRAQRAIRRQESLQRPDQDASPPPPKPPSGGSGGGSSSKPAGQGGHLDPEQKA